jgi:hypothetical protein
VASGCAAPRLAAAWALDTRGSSIEGVTPFPQSRMPASIEFSKKLFVCLKESLFKLAFKFLSVQLTADRMSVCLSTTTVGQRQIRATDCPEYRTKLVTNPLDSVRTPEYFFL